MTRLPTPGGDDDVWGIILNDFLDIAHNSDGSLKAHDHTASDVTDFGVAADARITAQKAAANGLASLDNSTKIPITQIPTGVTAITVAVGDHTHDDRYYTESEVNTALAGKISTSEKGAPNGVAVLDATGKIDSSQFPAVISNRLIGEIVPWPTGTAPNGWIVCDGAAISRATYADLFGVIGTTYGAGDGSTTFNLPDFRGRSPMGYDASQVEFNAIGKTGGAKTHTLTTAEMPSHTHVQNAHGHAMTGTNFGSGMAAVQSSAPDGSQSNRYQIANGISNVSAASTTATNQNTGGDGAHNNLQPYQVTIWIIKAVYTSGEVEPTAHVHTASEISDFSTQVDGMISGIMPSGVTMMWMTGSAPGGWLLCDGTAVSRTTYANLFAVLGTMYGAGDGTTTFNLPDMRGRVPVGVSADTEFNSLGKTGGAKTHTLTSGEMPSHTHTQNSHSHTLTDPGHNHTQNAHGHNVTDPGHYHSQIIVPGTLGGTEKILVSDYNGGGTKSAPVPTTATNMVTFGSPAYTNNAATGVSIIYNTATNNANTTGITLAAATATNQNTGGGGAHNNLQPYMAINYIIKA